MIPKQHEMDGIVKQIYDAIESLPHLKSTLFVVTGDHGMNDAGNHGGSAAGETSPALVFMSPMMKVLKREFETSLEEQDDFRYYSFVEQSDLAPTLGALLGFPVPRNNLGAFIVDFLPLWPNSKFVVMILSDRSLTVVENDQVQLLVRNAKQILAIVTSAFGGDLFAANGTVDPCSHTETDIQELACTWQQVAGDAKSNSKDNVWESRMAKVLLSDQA